ncbi:hypothetical protein KIN20_015132 [Parelaphostrongylus tenuis]|uniref:Uncharacterized protein n=1 Tax=Parelaphostrongylus tenuis TaxID=148309 RepID=A0AAD5MEG0_PARTN|nr:hypothetical protein KIN20_015132 [Parelaphostrongylus tenuis]
MAVVANEGLVLTSVPLLTISSMCNTSLSIKEYDTISRTHTAADPSGPNDKSVHEGFDPICIISVEPTGTGFMRDVSKLRHGYAVHNMSAYREARRNWYSNGRRRSRVPCVQFRGVSHS